MNFKQTIIKAEKNKEKEPKLRVRFRFLLAEKEGFERSEPVSDGIASADRERCGMNMPRPSVTRSVPDIEAKRRARRRCETKKREWRVRQTPFFGSL